MARRTDPAQKRMAVGIITHRPDDNIRTSPESENSEEMACSLVDSEVGNVFSLTAVSADASPMFPRHPEKRDGQ